MTRRTSGGPWADVTRLQQIDASIIGAHAHLTLADECYFFQEYTSHRDYSFSKTNGLISNLKKKPSEHQRPGFQYKARAIAQCAGTLSQLLVPLWLTSGGVLVPVPPSKVLGHPDYDPRMLTICKTATAAVPAPRCVRELVRQTGSTTAAHEGVRPTVQDLLGVYQINEAEAAPPPGALAIVDDVLTAGTHFRAMHTILGARFPGVKIVGIFIARRVFPDDE